MTEHEIETREQLIARLRQQLRREPTPKDIQIALRYMDMAHQHAQSSDEADQ